MKKILLILCLSLFQFLSAQEAYDVLYLKGNFEQIKQRSGKLISAEDYFWYANMLCKEGETLNAIITLKAGVKRFRQSKIIENQLIECLFTSGQYKQAEALLAKNLENPVNFLRYIKILEFKSEHKKAIKLLVHNLKDDPTNISYLKHLGDNYTELDQSKAAIKVYTKVLDANPNDQVVASKLARQFLKRKDYSSAFTVCDNVLKVDTFNAKFIKLKGTASFNMEEYWTAYECFEYLLGKGDSSHFVVKHLGISEFHNKSYEKSIQHLTKAMQKDSTDFEVGFVLGMAHLKEGNEEESLMMFKQVEKLLQPKPELMSALYDKMISIYGMMNNPKNEMECYKLAYSYNPKPEYLFRIASLYQYQFEKPKKALEYYQEFLVEVDKLDVKESDKKENINISLEEVAKRSVVRIKEQLFMEEGSK